MNRLFRWFGGYVHISLSGRQINRFLNLCSRNDILIWNVTQDIGRYVRAHLKLKDFFYIKPFLKKTHTHINILGKHGYPFWCYRHPKLKWFPLYILMAGCIMAYSSTFVWQIKIEGNQIVSEQELLQFLETQNVEPGQKLSNIDCAQLEYNIRQNYNELGWVSVYIDKTSLHIDIRESLYEMHQEHVLDKKRYDIVANKDAHIYSLITRTGKALVVQGADVKKGDVLIEGTCDILNDNGEIKEVLQKKADALIIGDVEYIYVDALTDIELVALKIAGLYTDDALYDIAYKKINQFVEILEENGVIILDKSVMIDKYTKAIVFRAKITAREEIGITVPVEEITENEFE